MERGAVYAGSFDPITNGHVWMMEKGARMFDRLIVAIGENPDKEYAFSLEERLEMLRETCGEWSNVEIAHFEGQFLVDYAHAIGVRYILRGIRSEDDFHYEQGMRHVNADMRPEIDTVFLMPPRDLAQISSSMVEGLIGPQGWVDVVRRYVPPAVFRRLEQRYRQGS